MLRSEVIQQPVRVEVEAGVHQQSRGRRAWRTSCRGVVSLYFRRKASSVPLLVAAVAEVDLTWHARPEARQRISEPAPACRSAVSKVTGVLLLVDGSALLAERFHEITAERRVHSHANWERRPDLSAGVFSLLAASVLSQSRNARLSRAV